MRAADRGVHRRPRRRAHPCRTRPSTAWPPSGGGDEPDLSPAKPGESILGRRRDAAKPEDGPHRAADRVAVERIRARIGDEQRVRTGCARRAGDRAEVSGPFDRDGYRNERIARQVERIERRRRTPNDGEESVGLPLCQARECPGAELDHGCTAAFGCGNEVGVPAAGEQVGCDVQLLHVRPRSAGGAHRAGALHDTELT